MFKKIFKKINIIKTELATFDEFQRAFNEDNSNLEISFSFPKDIYSNLHIENNIFDLSKNKNSLSKINNDYLELDFLHLEIQRLFEKITNKSIKYSHIQNNAFYEKTHYRKRFQSLLLSDDTFQDIRYSIQLSNLFKKLQKSTENLKNTIKNSYTENINDFSISSLENEYSLYYNQTISNYSKIKELLNTILSNRLHKKRETKGLILAILSLSIPVILFLPDYMNYKEIEDSFKYTLNFKEKLVYENLVKNTSLNEFDIILNEGYENSNLNQSNIDIIKKQENIIKVKNQRISKRTYIIKFIFSCFAILSLVLILIFF